ncbi:MAG TPA: hypothetical protein PLU10_05925 [Chitinophagaceae bacterium]|nr:hypothetical protein [Chitinophagaceae bacterium]
MPKLYFAIAIILLGSSCNFFNKTAVKKASGPGAFQETASLTQQIEGKPDNAQLYFKRGAVLRTLKQDSLAILDFKKPFP